MNLNLNEEELQFLCNRTIFLLKRSLTGKLIQKLESVSAGILAVSESDRSLFPTGTLFSGKITKGENHHGFPYLVLDCPRYFIKTDIMTIRTVIWMGNSVSCSLHLHGECLRYFSNLSAANLLKISGKKEYYLARNSPWDYALSTQGFIPVTLENKEELDRMVTESNFLKISHFCPISKIESLEEFCRESSLDFLKILSAG